MNKLMIALALCAALAACKKDDAAATAPATADSGTAPADTAPAATPDAATPVQAGLPQECEDYINRVKACVAKARGNAAAAQFQASLDQAKAQWDAAADKASLAPACKAANDQFTQMAASLKCD